MKTGTKGIDLIKKYESLHDGDLKAIGLQPKMDCLGIWTEGYGRAMRDDKGNFIKGSANKQLAYSRITMHDEQEALSALYTDVIPREHIIAQNIKGQLNQNQFDALVSHIYNTGGSQTIYNMINKGVDEMVIHEWWCSHYIQGDGKILPGLVKRRKEEADLFIS